MAVGTADGHLLIRFADTPVGAGVCEIVIRFGPAPRRLVRGVTEDR